MSRAIGLAVGLAVALLFVACDANRRLSDHVASRRAAFSPRGPGLDLIYLTCSGESPPEVVVTEELDGRALEWETFQEEFFGSPSTRGTAYYYIRRGGESQEHADALAAAEDALLEITIFADDEKPLVIEDLQIADLASEGFTLADGSEVDDIDVHEWESDEPGQTDSRGCEQ